MAPMQIDPKTWRKLFDAVYEINTAADHADFLSSAVAGISRLIPAEHYNVHILDCPTGRLTFAMLPDVLFNEDEIAYHKANSQDHPVVAYYTQTGDKQARRITDILPTAQWRATEFYRRTTARLGFAYQLSLPFKLDQTTVAAITLSRRQRNFTRRHCELLDAFAPHFRLAWSRHRDPWYRAESTTPTTREIFRSMGLTTREAEVLFWITEGKQNREIATILGIRLGTVQEYVASILEKCDQENRHAITVYALGILKRG
jgi:DNA-binding CsgD family transcriptional regulator